MAHIKKSGARNHIAEGKVNIGVGGLFSNVEIHVPTTDDKSFYKLHLSGHEAEQLAITIIRAKLDNIKHEWPKAEGKTNAQVLRLYADMITDR